MRRRTFIAALGSVAAWPLVARAQQPAMPVIGWLGVVSAKDYADRVAAFHEGLKEAGFIENQNVRIEYRWADDQIERLPGLAAELVARRVAVIVTGGGTHTVFAAKAATTTIPIVFTIAADPVRAGLVGSLNRPGENITGISGLTDALITKRLELLTELVPNASVIGILVNPNNPNSKTGRTTCKQQHRCLAAKSRSCAQAVVASSTMPCDSGGTRGQRPGRTKRRIVQQ